MMATRMKTRLCKYLTNFFSKAYCFGHIGDKTPTYGELIDFLDYAEMKCVDNGSVTEILCSKINNLSKWLPLYT